MGEGWGSQPVTNAAAAKAPARVRVILLKCMREESRPLARKELSNVCGRYLEMPQILSVHQKRSETDD